VADLNESTASESTPAAALERLENLFVDAILEAFDDPTGDLQQWQIVTNAHAIAAVGLAAVLPALADELQREANLRIPKPEDYRGSQTYLPTGGLKAVKIAGWNDAIAHLRSLAAPADDQEAGK
jgi:hypothetical protein